MRSLAGLPDCPALLSRREQRIVRECIAAIDELLRINRGEKTAMLLVPLSEDVIRDALGHAYRKRGYRVEFLASLSPKRYWINIIPGRRGKC